MKGVESDGRNRDHTASPRGSKGLLIARNNSGVQTDNLRPIWFNNLKTGSSFEAAALNDDNSIF